MRIRKWALSLWMLPLAAFMVVATPTLLSAAPMPGNSFDQHNLVSDMPGVASYTDPDLMNPWGVAFSGTSPFWVADNGTGLATLYNGLGVKQGLVVTHSSTDEPDGPSTRLVRYSIPTLLILAAHISSSRQKTGTISAWNGRDERRPQSGRSRR